MANSTHNRAARRKGGCLRPLLWALVIFVVGAVIVLLGAYNWARRYLAGDAFRVYLAEQVGQVVGGEVEIEPLVWDRLAVRTPKLSAEGGGLISRLEMEDPRATVSLSALTSGVWVINNAGVERVVVDLKMPGNGKPAAPVARAAVSAHDSNPVGLPGWFPTKVKIPQIQIRDASLRFGQGEMDFRILNSGVLVESRDAGSWDVGLRGGKFRVKPFPGAGIKDKAFEIVDGALRVTPDTVFVLNSRMKSDDGTSLAIDGTMPGMAGDGPLDINTFIQNLPVAQILGSEWVNRLFGRLTVKNRSHSVGEAFIHEGSAELADARFVTPNAPPKVADGIIGKGWDMLAGTVIPVLGAYTDRTVQFRNLVCDTARCDYRIEGGTMELKNIMVRSRGMLGIEGTLTIRGQAIDGTLMLGVTRETLGGIPGAESKVFTVERDGLVWTEVKVSGTLEDPQEDLTKRLIDAAGDRLLESLPGLDLIKGTLRDLELPDVKTGVDDLLDQGGKILDGVLPLRR